MNPTETLASRKHPALALRENQMNLNRLAMEGGEPYIKARLWRTPNESDRSWAGNPEEGLQGRRDRASCVNDAGRIAAKINQYLFSQETQRQGADPEWTRDVTNDGSDISQFWMDVSDELTCARWCWVQTDRAAPTFDEAGNIRARTLAEKRADEDFIFWKLWPAASVPDWHFDEAGNLVWLITHETTFDASDPFKEPARVATRTLWRRAKGGATYSRWATRDGQTTLVAEGTISPLEEVPFVCVGKPSPKPWWFDGVERIQAQCMNLDSLHDETLARAVFPQVVVPDSVVRNIEERLEFDGKSNEARLVREILRGLDTPLMESVDEKGITRFIQPTAADLKALPDECARKRQTLFDLVGLALFNRETRQVQSAESKAFDHLDTESTLGQRARILETAERRLVALSAALDPGWASYDPQWPEKFDAHDPEADIALLTPIAQLPDLTPTQRKAVRRGVTRLIQAFAPVSDEDLAKIGDEIENGEGENGEDYSQSALEGLYHEVMSDEGNGE